MAYYFSENNSYCEPVIGILNYFLNYLYTKLEVINLCLILFPKFISRKPTDHKAVMTSNKTQEQEGSATPTNIVQKRKKQLLSSVRGWLLYKSALDLWDDVNSQNVNSLPNTKQANALADAQRPLALRQSSSAGHLATLGHYNGDKNQAAQTLPADVQRPSRAQVKSLELLPSSGKKSFIGNESGGGSTLKRSKSLWKFRRFNRDDDGILEGMSLWQHRSLVDVRVAVQQEDETALSTPTTIKKKSTGTNTSQTLETTSVPANDESPTPLMRTKLVPLKDDNDILNGNPDTPPKPMERKSIKSSQNGGIFTNTEHSDRKNSPPIPSKKPPIKNNTDIKDDDGLLIPRSGRQMYCSSDEEGDVDFDDETTDAENGDSESCIVVDDHMKAKISLTRRQKILREASRLSTENGMLLPRTRLVKAHGRKNNVEMPTPADGLLYYGRTLQYRLKKPERGSRFDQVSEITGNMYGPWYDLWGVDSSVRQ